MRIIFENKKGNLISVYWFVMLFVVAAGIAWMTISFYGSPSDVRSHESNALTNRIADCISQGGYLKDNVLTEDFRENFLKECNLNFSVEDFNDWKNNQQYYTELDLYKYQTGNPTGMGDLLLNVSEGNVNLRFTYLTQQVAAAKTSRNVNAVVIHYTAENLLDSMKSLSDARLSIHYMIDKDGTIFSSDNIKLFPQYSQYQNAFIPESEVAQHAGCIASSSDDLSTSKARPECSDACVDLTKSNPAKLLDSSCQQLSHPPQDQWCCIPGFNENSIGIEMVNYGDVCNSISCADSISADGEKWDAYTPAQIDSLVSLVSDITARYDVPLDRNHIVGHYQITTFKVDPGPAFPWDDFMARLKSQPVKVPSTVGESFYVIDKNNNEYVAHILSIVGKTEKNVA